jgi:hypothetical protein
MTEPLVSGPSYLEVETAIAKLKKYKLPSSDEIPADSCPIQGDALSPLLFNFALE